MKPKSKLETAHTPGPWRITSDAGHSANIRITATSRRHIAKVYAESLARDRVCEANARLIAAAPALYGFALNVAKMCHAETCDRSPDCDCLYASMARNLLATAQ